VRLRYTLRGIQATDALGNCLSRVLEPGSLLLLSGDLGAGKTSLTKAIASGLGIEKKEVTSPSFAIIHEYLNGRLPLIHADLYRLGFPADITETGLEDYLDGENVIIIEWAEYLRDPLLETSIKIKLFFIDEQDREAHVSGKTEIWGKRFLQLADCMKAPCK
jgi:tRNA threonylcarbamoyladenosine biosynthesis protein TsaE